MDHSVYAVLNRIIIKPKRSLLQVRHKISVSWKLNKISKNLGQYWTLKLLIIIINYDLLNQWSQQLEFLCCVACSHYYYHYYYSNLACAFNAKVVL